MIVTVQSSKGGTGKTTLSTHLSQGLATLGNKVLLVDSDPQGSARDWMGARQDNPQVQQNLFEFVALDRPIIHTTLPPMAAKYDYTIIDGSPRNSPLCKSAIAAADLVLIPVQPSPYDVWAVAETLELVKEVQVLKPKLQSVFVINRKIANTVIGRDVVVALADYHIPVLKSQISQRVSFPEAAAVGGTVLEIGEDKAAKLEIKNLIQEFIETYG